MFDRRVARGCNVDIFTESNGEEAIRERMCQKTITEENLRRIRTLRSFYQRLKCPMPVVRHPAPVKAESIYEEIDDPPVTYITGLCSEMFPETTGERTFKVAMTYRNQRTQVREVETFDFDVEVQPFLEVLVGTSVREAMHDAITETELMLDQAQRVHFRSRVTVERAELEGLSEQDRRYREEKERREAQFPVGCVKQGERARAAAPLQQVKGCKDGLRANALEGFRPAEYRRDVIKKELQATAIPLLLQKINVTTSTKVASRDLLAGMVRDATINISQQSDVMEDTRCRMQSCSSNDTDGVLHSDEEWQLVEGRRREETVSEISLIETGDMDENLSMAPDVPRRLSSNSSNGKENSVVQETLEELVGPSSPSLHSLDLAIEESTESWSGVIHEVELRGL